MIVAKRMTLAEQITISSQLDIQAELIEFYLEEHGDSIPEKRRNNMKQIAVLLRAADAAIWKQQRRIEVLCVEVGNRAMSEQRSKEMFDRLAKTML